MKSGPLKRGNGSPRARRWGRALHLALAPILVFHFRHDAAAAGVSEQAVQEHIEHLKSTILQGQDADGSWSMAGYSVGLSALALLALKHAGLPEDHPALLRGTEFIAGTFAGNVYGESLVICALELIGPGTYRRRIENAVDFLAGAQSSAGGWSYADSRGAFDNSNTQFAVLGLAAAERCGVAVPPRVKRRALDHWLASRASDGGWSYHRGGSSYLAMTCAGIASLHLLGRVYEKPGSRCGEYEYDTVVQKGLQALLRQLRTPQGGRHGWGPSYALYALERVGMFLDLKEIEGLDWYRWGAERILREGGGSGLPDLALDLLFLARGEAQVAIAKWRWQGDWNNDHHDLKNWVALGSEELKLKLDWIPARLDAKASPAGRASMVFVSGHGRFIAKTEEADFLRGFLADGGTLVAEACCGSPAFADSFKEFVRTLLLPAIPVEFLPLPPGHPVCQQRYTLTPEEVSALEVKTGCARRRILILTRDLSCALNGEPCGPEERERARKLAVNLLQWAMRAKAPRGKLAEIEPAAAGGRALRPGEDEVEASPAGASRSLRQPFGRLIHRGEWDADLAFFPTLKQAIAGQESLPVFDGEVFVKPASEDLFACPVLFVTGHRDPKLAAEEWLPLRTYLQAGGTVIASACCGSEEFDRGLRRLLASVLPNDKLEEIPGDDAIWKTPYPRQALPLEGSKALLERLRREEKEGREGKRPGPLYGIRREGRWVAIYSPVDLCCDLEGDLDEDTLAYKKATSIPLWANLLKYAFTP